MVSGAFLTAVVPGVLVLLFTLWFRKLNLSFFLRLVPGVLLLAAAAIVFYVGFVEIRGFEGGAYLLLAFFLIGFGLISIVLASKK